MATTYNLSPVYQGPQLSNSGALLVGGKIYWYLAGTSTPVTVYQNASGSAAHTQPIILDARGEPTAPIYLAGGNQYKAVLQDSSGVQLQVIDNIIGVGDSSFANYSIGQLTIDSTGNGAKLFQGASGDLEILTNLNSGTSGLWKFSNTSITFPDASTISTGYVIPSGTKMLFVQASAPTGWTKVTTYNDYALRIVSGSGGGTGGSVAFTTAFSNVTSTGAFTLTTNEIPSHTHIIGPAVAASGTFNASGSVSNTGSQQSGTTGGGASHSHSLSSLAVQYIDSIIAVKD